MLEERENFIGSKFSVHDRQRFEVKLNINLQSGKKNSFKIEYFFFIPRSLNVSPENYTKEIFYADTQHYIRFKTPSISIDKLFYPQNKLSPYNRVIKGLDSLNSGINGDFIVEIIIDEMKLLGAILRAEMRDLLAFFGSSFKNENVLATKDLLLKFKSDVNMALNSIETLKTRIFTTNIDPRIKESFLMLDEYVSLIVEEYLTNLICEIKALGNSELNEVLPEFIKMVRERQKYRVFMGYKSVFNKNDEHFIYHRSLLKKFISSALYLVPDVSGFNLISHLGPAIAAGIAMLFAIIVTIYAQSKYAINSMSFVFIIVISYIFKDRIKDWLKIIFSKTMWNMIYDRKINVMEPTHKLKLGYIKETFSFIPVDMVPLDIMRIRNIDNKRHIEEDIKQERVFKYRKEINLNPHSISRYHKRRKDMIDIIRFSVFDFTKHADDEFVDYKILNEKEEIENIKCIRVYHLNMVIKYCLAEEDVKYERIRILLNKNGIVKLEKVSVG